MIPALYIAAMAFLAVITVPAEPLAADRSNTTSIRPNTWNTFRNSQAPLLDEGFRRQQHALRRCGGSGDSAPAEELGTLVRAMAPMLARTREESGDQHVKLGDYLAAVEEYQEALTLYRYLGNGAKTIKVLFKIGNVHARQSQYDAAIGSYKEALAFARDISDIAAEGRAYRAIGICYERQKEYKQVRNAYEQALAAFQQGGDVDAAREVLQRLHPLYSFLVQVAEGIAYYEKALKKARQENQRGLEGLLLQRVADLACRRGRFAEALQRYQEALAIVREIADRPSEAAVLRGIGDVYERLGEYDESLVNHEAALAIGKAIDETITMASTLLDIGGIYVRKGRYEEAIKQFTLALEKYREIDDKEGVAASFEGLGDAYSAQTEMQEAIAHWEQALDLYQDAGLRFKESVLLLKAATLHGRMGQLEEAATYFERVLPIIVGGSASPPLEAMFRGILAAMKCAGGRERCEESVAETIRAIMVLETTDAPQLRWVLWTLLKDMYVLLERYSSAIIAGKQAVNILQTVRTTNVGLPEQLMESFVGTEVGVYRGLAALLIREGRIAEAEQVLGMLKEKEYFEFVRRDAEADDRTARAAYTPAEQAWWERYAQATGELVAVARRYSALERSPSLNATERATLVELEAILDRAQEGFLQILAALNKEFEDEGSRARALGERQLDFLEGLQPTLVELGPGTVLIHTIVTRDRLYLILTTPDVRLVRESPIREAALNRIVGRFRKVLRDPNSDPRTLGQQLYQHLVEPLQEDLLKADARMLMWSLDGALRYIPLAALYDGQRYLVERYPVALYTPAAQSSLAAGAGKAWQVAGLGVSRSHAGFQALTGVPQELEGIVKRSEADADGVVPGVIYLDDLFNRDGLKQVLRERYPIVHIASHFRLGPADARSSFLLLGDGSTLNLEDFRKGRAFSLNGVDLLTLSACSTAIASGDQAGGEVESFGVLAQKRGAGGVIATLWPVADQSTALLMRHFYGIRSEEPTWSKADALRYAQLALLRGERSLPHSGQGGERGLKRLDAATDTTRYHGPAPFAHPYYWAPFILMGNWL